MPNIASISLESSLKHQPSSVEFGNNRFSRPRDEIVFDTDRKSKDLKITLLNGKQKTIKLYESAPRIKVIPNSDVYMQESPIQSSNNFSKNYFRVSKYSSLLEKSVESLKLDLTAQVMMKCVNSLV
jgi:hypothetical protein